MSLDSVGDYTHPTSFDVYWKLCKLNSLMVNTLVFQGEAVLKFSKGSVYSKSWNGGYHDARSHIENLRGHTADLLRESRAA